MWENSLNKQLSKLYNITCNTFRAKRATLYGACETSGRIYRESQTPNEKALFFICAQIKHPNAFAAIEESSSSREALLIKWTAPDANPPDADHVGRLPIKSKLYSRATFLGVWVSERRESPRLTIFGRRDWYIGRARGFYRVVVGSPWPPHTLWVPVCVFCYSSFSPTPRLGARALRWKRTNLHPSM